MLLCFTLGCAREGGEFSPEERCVCEKSTLMGHSVVVSAERILINMLEGGFS